jgi:hypothetical protein
MSMAVAGEYALVEFLPASAKAPITGNDCQRQ